jgi:hypothetical protein
MSRTVNRPGMNITAPTLPAPEAAEYGVKVARAVTRYAHLLREMLNGSVEARKMETRDHYTLMSAGLIARAGEHRERIVLTVEGGLLAKKL